MRKTGKSIVSSTPLPVRSGGQGAASKTARVGEVKVVDRARVAAAALGERRANQRERTFDRNRGAEVVLGPAVAGLELGQLEPLGLRQAGGDRQHLQGRE
jgi:hypothetical protein